MACCDAGKDDGGRFAKKINSGDFPLREAEDRADTAVLPSRFLGAIMKEAVGAFTSRHEASDHIKQDANSRRLSRPISRVNVYHFAFRAS